MTDGYASIDPQHAVIITVDGDPPLIPTGPQVALDLSKFQSGRWALQLDSVFARRREPAVIVAQGVACLAVAWWAQLSPRSYLQSIRGAAFLSPLNIGFGQDAIAAAARLGPSTRLPFPSIVASAGYPFMNRLMALADGWGSHLFETGDLTRPDTAIDEGPTNRRPPRTSEEAQLIALLPLVVGASHVKTVQPSTDATTAIQSR